MRISSSDIEDAEQLLDVDENEEPSVNVVRVKTSWWKDERGLHYRKDILTMKGLSSGYQILQEDSSNIGAYEVGEKIDFQNCSDGLYEVIITNQTYDWETGYLDDYDYKLVPYKLENNKT